MSTTPLTEQELQALNRLHSLAKEGNYYGILGVAPGADGAKIQAAYYQLSRDWHPDRHFRRKLGEDLARIEFVFVTITKAYKVLSNEETRRRYHRDNKEMVALVRAEQQDAEREARRKRAREKARAEGQEGPRRKKRTAEERAARERIARKRADPRARAMKKLRDQVKGRSSRARRYFNQGQEDYNAGNISKAVSSLHLAVQFEPNNAEYRALYELARSQASSSLSVQYTQAGESAESFQNYKEAMFNYERACEQNPEDGLPFFRLAVLVLKIEQDQRKALGHLRTAASKSPKSVEIRLTLADLYADLGMSLNAKREYQTVLGIDKNNARARSGLRSVR